jgi:hypothetical protein
MVTMKGVAPGVGHEPVCGPGLLLQRAAQQVTTGGLVRSAREIVTEKRSSKL